MTLREFLEHFASDRTAALTRLARDAAAAVDSLGRRRNWSPELAEACIADAVADLIVRDAAPLRRARDPDASLPGWLVGAAVLQRRRRASKATNGIDLGAVPARDPDDGPPPDLAAAGVDLAILTTPQRRAWELRLAGLSERQIASAAGVQRDAVRERLARGLSRLRAGEAPAAADRQWAVSAAAALAARGRDDEAAILRLYAAGASRAAIAASCGRTSGAVRQFVARTRGKFGRTESRTGPHPSSDS